MADTNGNTLDPKMQQDLANRLAKAVYDATMGASASKNNIASQSAMSDRVRSNGGWDMGSNSNSPWSPPKHRGSGGSILDEFEAGIRDELLDTLVDGDFKKGLKSALSTFEKGMGASIEDIPKELGKNLAKRALNSDLGKDLTAKARNLILGDGQGNGGLLGSLKGSDSALSNVIGNTIESLFTGGAEAAEGAGLVGESMAGAGAAATGTTAAMAELTEVIGAIASGPFLPAVIAIGAALVILEPAIEGLIDLTVELGKSAFRADDEAKKRREAAQQRLQSDVEYMVKKPFEILTQAATEWYNTWDNNLRKIGQTQGYTKDDVYDLYSSYAERLAQDGLTATISATEIISKLSQTLDTGLSGKAAEEFAYVATKLNNAIPNQDFFQYAASYAQIAATAISQGKSQEEALASANEQLEQFASNLLYSSRELAGGFSTGLSNASQLFSDAVNIAQAAKIDNADAISGTLTSVSAIIGAVAPDLASGLVSNIVDAALGGNTDTVVALRSLAGINASNTEFLKALAEDPQKIFSDLFTKLSELQNMSNENFMEVAEGLSSVFGVDKAAFARVDFKYLADSISAMQVNTQSLGENLKLLSTGETTTTAEQAKLAEINQMILEDGLAIVLDNEAARTIQEHMWQEQQTVALTSATYAVDLQGSALDFLSSIKEVITTISRILNPIGAMMELVDNISNTMAEQAEQEAALSAIVSQGAIRLDTSEISNTILHNLTDYSGSSVLDVFNEGIDNASAGSIINSRLANMYGYTVESELAEAIRGAADLYRGFGTVVSAFTTPWTIAQNLGGERGIRNSIDGLDSSIREFAAENAAARAANTGTPGEINTAYTWSTVGKTQATITSTISEILASAADRALSNTTSTVQETTTETTDQVADAITDFLNSVQEDQSSITNYSLAAQRDEEEKYSRLAVSISESNRVSFGTWFEGLTNQLETLAGNPEDFNVDDLLYQYGLSQDDFEARYQNALAMAQSKVAEERENLATSFYYDGLDFMPETRKFWDYDTGNYKTQFWDPFYADDAKFDKRINAVLAEMQNIRDNWIGDTDKSKTVRGLLTTIDNTLNAFNLSFDNWVKDWTNFYINHTTYSERTNQTASWDEMLSMEAAANRDTSLMIAESLTKLTNLEDLKDPTVQSNVLLAKIVVLLEAIMQQNNTTGGLSLIDSIGALSLGLAEKIK